MENSEIKDRILKFLNTENMSSAKFADIIGVQRSNISHIISGRNNPGLDFLQKVLTKFPTLNPEWLLIGKGEMFKQIRQKEINFEPEHEPSPFLYKKSQAEIIQQQNEKLDHQVIQKQKSIKQVIVFYDDSTYEILNPDKSEKD